VTRAERFSRYFARHRHAFALAITLVTVFFAWQMRQLEIFTEFLDLLPRSHPYIETYEQYRGVYGTANTVVAAVVAREGDIYQPGVIEAILVLTEGLDSSITPAEVNARPASEYVTPSGAVARAVHAMTLGADAIFRRGESVPADTGVEHNLTSSLTHRSARDLRVRVDGTLESPQLVVEIPTTAEAWRELRERVQRNPSVYGPVVSTDERASLVRVSFVESRLDYGALFKHVQQLVRDVEARYPVDVYVTGQPILFGWAYAFSTEILLVFFFTVLVSGVLLWAYLRRAFGVFLPLSGAAVNMVWGLGFAAWMGFNLDPLVLVVPMLITARAISHSVQFVERFYEEYERLGDKREACILSMSELLLPGTMAILTDCVGLLTISLATIPLVRELGLLCAFWAASIAVTEMLLNRLFILYLPAPRTRQHYVPRPVAAMLEVAARVVRSRAGALTVVGVFAGGAVLCFGLASQVPIGENRPGSPILYPDAEFNVAAREIGDRFFGLDDLQVIAHAETPGRVYAPDSLKWLESLQRALETDPKAGGSISFVDLFKQTLRTYHHNDPRWAMWPQDTAEMSGFLFFLETAVPSPGILDAYRSRDGRSLSVRVFYRDHQADTVREANARLRHFAAHERLDGSLAIRLEAPLPHGWRRLFPSLARLLPAEPTLAVSVPDEAVFSPDGRALRRMLPAMRPEGERWEHGQVLARFEEEESGLVAELRRRGRFGPFELWVRPSGKADWDQRASGVWLRDGVELRLAAGSIGILAASNEEIGASHSVGLAVVFLATFLIITLSYRSFLVGGLLIVSLATAALAALAVQTAFGIGVNVNTLPVQAIGVGVGVDYAIYIVDRILQERANGLERRDAIARGIRTTGLAIAFTASTLIAGIIFWIPISSLRFSAEMSLLLSILMTVNALGAVLLVPALLSVVPESWWPSAKAKFT
jgi:predicted RND superfamily exporter protein